jgi:hypothetical protein
MMAPRAQSPPSAWRRWHDGEQGANTFVVIAVCFSLILLTPIFVDYANLHFTRRVAQTGADSAALAAAIEYAKIQVLSVDRHCGPCVSPGRERRAETEEYIRDILRPRATNPSIGQPFASAYALRHRTRLLHYSNHWPFYNTNKVYYKEGIPIYPLAIYVKGERPTDMAYQTWYGGPFEAPARATSEVYLKRVPWTETHFCGTEEDPKFYHCAWYRWQVRLRRYTD